ncbi:hypothetical protein [Kitasatospora sp. NPDC089509]|uniref:hypothetical protein n=1 Tax=Kitasatospora sp. NPDC089509 TaxID=3364079 RepID=UPI0038155CCB
MTEFAHTWPPMPDAPPAPRHRVRPLTAAGAVAALMTASVAGGYWLRSADDGLDYVNDYVGHPPLRVVGYPSTGTLELTQRIVWRLADGSSGALAGLATSDGSAREALATAGNWVAAFGAGARGAVTADFYDEGSVRQTVVLYFHDTGLRKQLTLRLDGPAGADGWKVLLREPDPEKAAAPPTWAPATPGGRNSSAG